MTRIRLSEWLFAGVLVVALHALALTGLAWLAPASESSAPQPRIAAAADPVPLTVELDLPEPQAALPAAIASTPASSSNEIIIVPTEPTAPLASGQSAAFVEVPQNGPLENAVPQNPARQDAVQQDDFQRDEVQQDEVQQSALQVAPAEPVSPPDTTGAREEHAAQAARSPLRNPVPLPKPRPAAPASPQAPAATPAPESRVEVAAVGTNRPAVESTPVSAAHSSYYRLLLAEVMRAQVYPEAARREDKTGTVYLQIVVQRTGRIKSYDIVKSSGFQELDDAAVQSLVKANPVPPFPDGIAEEELRFGLPMRFGS